MLLKSNNLNLRVYLFVFISLFVLNVPSFAFSFAVFGDNRDGDKIYQKILNKVIDDEEIEFAFNTGDFVSHGKYEEYRDYLDLIKNLNIKIYHVQGNHDAIRQGYKYFNKFFGPSYYSFDYENAHFIVLDNAFSASFDKAQYNWLLKDLESNKKIHAFVFMHKPNFDSTEFYPDHLMDSRRMNELLIKTFSKFKVDYVFAGHIHGYGKAERNGVVYVITGGAGAPLYIPYYAGGFYHYVKITVDGDDITDEVVKLED